MKLNSFGLKNKYLTIYYIISKLFKLKSNSIV